jgi:cell wall-associated NlpC family hydrolase
MADPADAGRSVTWMTRFVVAVSSAMLLLPALIAGVTATVTSDTVPGMPVRVPGIPPIVLDAYLRAAAMAPRVAPKSRGMRWSILAGIGKIESNHLAGQHIDPDGTVRPPFLGPRLDGSGVGGNTSPIYDTDHGRYDGDTVYDRAVGLMQFIPGTWHRGGYSGPHGDGRDGNGDGVADPNNVYDSALAAVVHLAGNRPVDFTDPTQLDAAIYRYNHATWYVRKVRAEIDRYDQIGAITDPGSSASGSGRGQIAVRSALKWLGTPYSWGGGNASGPTYGIGRGAHTKGFDCSGLTVYAWAQAGVRIDRTADAQYNDGTHIPIDRLQPGDLLFFAYNQSDPATIHHVGIYLSPGKMINAPQTGDHVRVAEFTSPYRQRQLIGATRPTGARPG